MTLLATVLLSASLARPAYTNHAGHAVWGHPVAITNGLVTFARDGTNRWAVAFSAFPPHEQERLRAAIGDRPRPTTGDLRRDAFVRDMKLRREALRKAREGQR